MSLDEKTLTIVYQFGKVASTSLVNTLREQSHLDVHQSHFLGEDALKRIVQIAVARSTNPYFHEHLSGQLMANIALTYRMNRALGSQSGNKVKIISLSREPLDWLRSGILQDIDGYRDEVIDFAQRHRPGVEDENAALQVGLAKVLSQINELIDAFGGAEQTVAAFHKLGGKDMLTGVQPQIEPIVRRLFFLALRPLTWFEEHFKPCFGHGLDDFEQRDGYWVARQPRADFVLLRYEDLAHSLSTALAAIDIEVSRPLVRDNISRTKPYSGDVAASFVTPDAHELRRRLSTSDYAKYFGYRMPAEETAAE